MLTISAGCADPLDETKENCYMKSQGNMTCGEGRGLGGGGERKFPKWNIGVVSQVVNSSNG